MSFIRYFFSPKPPPGIVTAAPNNYVAENGTDNYVAENGTDFYVTES